MSVFDSRDSSRNGTFMAVVHSLHMAESIESPHIVLVTHPRSCSAGCTPRCAIRNIMDQRNLVTA
eukprot:14839901-Alexandrium_andersonii.AAC.1